MKKETITLDFYKEDFIDSNYNNGRTCPLAKVVQRMISPDFKAGSYGLINITDIDKETIAESIKTVFNGKVIKSESNYGVNSGYDMTVYNHIMDNLEVFESCTITLRLI